MKNNDDRKNNLVRSKSSNALLALIVMILIIDASLLYIIEIPNVSSNNAGLIVILSIICLVAYSLHYLDRLKNIFSSPMMFVILLILMMYVIESLLTCIFKPSISLYSALSDSKYILVVLLAIPLYTQLVVDRGYKKLFKILIVISSICSIAMILQSVNYQINHTLLFPSMLGPGGMFMVREFGFRVEVLSCLISIMIIYTFCQMIYGPKSSRLRLFYSVSFVVNLSAIVFVYQTRLENVCIFAALLVVIIFASPNWNSKIWIIGIIALIFVFLAYSGFIGDFMNSFSANSQYGGSTTSREGTISRCLESFYNNPIIGNGFDNQININKQYQYDDVGFIGQLGKWGLIFVVAYSTFLLRLLYITIKVWKYADVLDRSLLIGSLIYIILTSVSIICFDSQRIMRVPIILSLFEFISYKYRYRDFQYHTEMILNENSNLKAKY